MSPHPEQSGFRRRYFLGKPAEDTALLVLRLPQIRWAHGAAHALLARIHRAALLALRQLPAPRPEDLPPPRQLGVPHRATLVTAYDPAWPAYYGIEADLIRKALEDPAVEVLHIGSTAVPGLAAKPIIDIGLGLRPGTFGREAARTISRLARIGYRYLGDRPGLGGHFLEKGPFPLRTHAIQLHPAGGRELTGLLAFRDELRRDPALAAEYQAIKHGLAARTGGDRRIYLWYKAHWMNDLLLERREGRAWGHWLLAHPPPSFYWLHLRRRPRRKLGRP